MKFLLTLFVIVTLSIFVCNCAPVDSKDVNKDSKSAFGPAFDEIVVESSLTVRRKSTTRQGRTESTIPAQTTTNKPKKVKRQINNRKSNHNNDHQNGLSSFPNFGSSAANAQAQAFNSFGPLGSFGASAAGTQTQSFGIGPNGLSGAAGFAGSQHYDFNGQSVDIAFGNSFSQGNENGADAGGAAITVTGPDGKKRPFNG